MKKTAPQGSGPSQRQLRVGEVVRHALAEILARGEAHDPVLDRHPITVPEVRLSPDLKIATCYVMPLGGVGADQVIQALAANKAMLRTEIARRINMRYAPDLRFRLDGSFDEGDKIDRLLESPAVRRDTRRDTRRDGGDER